nr:MAG TPA: hypothetical protein [Caudoviricetes sp.]
MALPWRAVITGRRWRTKRPTHHRPEKRQVQRIS